MTETPKSTTRRAEADAITQAMERLFSGTSTRSSGRLSIVALAAEAGMKKTRLYDHHRDLVAEFNRRAGNTSREPGVAELASQLQTARRQIRELQNQIDEGLARERTLLAVIAELSLLADDSSNVIQLR